MLNDVKLPSNSAANRVSKAIKGNRESQILTPNQQIKALTMAEQLEAANKKLKPAIKNTKTVNLKDAPNGPKLAGRNPNLDRRQTVSNIGA